METTRRRRVPCQRRKISLFIARVVKTNLIEKISSFSLHAFLKNARFHANTLKKIRFLKMSPPPSITSSNIAEAYAKWDKYVENVDSEDEDERLRQENIDQHETYRKWQWEQKQQQKFDPMQAKRVNWENMGGNNSENRIKERMKAKEKNFFKQKTLTEYSWADFETYLVVYVKLDIVDNVKLIEELAFVPSDKREAFMEKRFDVEFRKFSFDCVVDLSSEFALFAVSELAKEIVPERSSVMLQQNGMMTFTLQKFTRERWMHLRRGEKGSSE